MKNISRVAFLAFFILFLVLRFNIDFPVTLDEAKESYTAYSILKTWRDTNGDVPGIFFRGDNNYLSSLGVYLRIPTIAVFGLTNLGVRIPSLFLGFISVCVFYLLSRYFLKDRSRVFFATFLFLASPFFIQINIFDLGATLGLLFALLSLYFFVTENFRFLVVVSFLAILSSFSTLPFVFVILSFYAFKKGKIRLLLPTILGMVFILVLILKLNQGLSDFLIRKTVIKDILPESYSYIIDKSLSFGLTMSSPLVTERFNFNRIAHNKLFYGIRELFKSLVKPFDYELLTSSFQSQTILAKERLKPKVLPKFFFWEIPFVFIGFILLIRKKNFAVSALVSGSLLSVLMFRERALWLLLPIIIFSETILIFYLKKVLNPIYFKGTLLVIAVLIIWSLISFLDLFWNHKFLWFNEQDLRQYQIWTTISDEDLRKNRIIVTDRLGEPINYFLFYEKIEPNFYQNKKKLGVITSAGVQRIERVGNVEFRSFKYLELSKGENEIWIGMAGEFVGENKDFEKITDIADGEIFKRIKNVRQQNKFIGDELWFVRTTL